MSQSPACEVQGRRPAGFTLVELLVTIVIIGMLASIVMGGLNYARSAAREAATKATIAKLHNIIMAKYESYLTRRVPVNTAGTDPKIAARMRLDAIRDLMRMEMPERWNDVTDDPYSFSWGAIPRPALSQMYKQMGTTNTPGSSFGSAKCLYMIVSADPENMEQFSRNEIDVDASDHWSMFIDGWGNPINFLRWAPGFTLYSNLQSGNAQADHDPFDTRRIEPNAYKLVPLIYSAGADKMYGLKLDKTGGGTGAHFAGNPYDLDPGNPPIGSPVPENGVNNSHLDNIDNHHIEQK